MPVFFEYENKVRWGQWCKFRDLSLNIQILVKKNKVEFVKTYNLRQRFSKKCLPKCMTNVLRSYLNPSSVYYNLSAYEQQHF